ncbi:MAG TPA: hypothetical protein VKA48_01285, partial [Gammaproteobacteria bacterium]|nr:hypothetical protein [Gammaproteobacteria bacterium]
VLAPHGESGRSAGVEAVHRATLHLGPMSRTGQAVALLGRQDFSGDCEYPTDPFRANFDRYFHSGYRLEVEGWKLESGADGRDLLVLTYSFQGKGHFEAVWAVDLDAGSIIYANTQARRLSCL